MRGRKPNNQLTDKRYYGDVCSKHPDLNGLRLISHKTCVQCHRDFSYKASRKPHTLQKAADRHKQRTPNSRPNFYQLTPGRFIGDFCDIHSDCNIRYKSNSLCVICNYNKQKASTAKRNSK